MDSSQSLLKQRNPPNTLILVQGDPFHVSDLQNCKIINVYCFKLKKKKKKKKQEMENLENTLDEIGALNMKQKE